MTIRFMGKESKMGDKIIEILKAIPNILAFLFTLLIAHLWICEEIVRKKKRDKKKREREERRREEK